MEVKETMTILNKKTKELETFNIHTGEIVARSGDLVPIHMYSLETAEAIANLVREGLTYEKVSKAMGISIQQIYSWRRIHPEFDKELLAARKDRGTYFHDKAVDVLEETDTLEREEVPGAKFKFDSYLKLAGISAPSEYAPQPKVASVATPATIIINTGINREPITIEEIHERDIPITDSPREEEESGEGTYQEAQAQTERNQIGVHSSRASSGTLIGGSNQKESNEEESDKEESNQEEVTPDSGDKT